MRLLVLFFGLVLLACTAYHAEAQARIVGPSDNVRVVISDWDLNGNPRGVDRYNDPEFVVFQTNRNEVGEAHPEIVETGPSTGQFEFTIQLQTDDRACILDRLDDSRFAAEGGSDPSVGVCPGDILMIQYEDNRGAEGRSTLVDYVFEVMSWNPEFTTDRSSYAIGERITIDIFDPDADRNPDVPDTLRDVRVFSESDPAGKQISAVETGANTGTFRLAFMTSLQAQGSTILVRNPEQVTVQYFDDFPADFADLQEEKRFNFVIIVGDAVDEGILSLSKPEVKTLSGGLTAGQQAALSIVASSFSGASYPFVAIMEVRNADGATVSLGWQTGYLDPLGRIELGMSWVPLEPGRYEVRAFLLSDPQNPQILSSVASSEVTVA